MGCVPLKVALCQHFLVTQQVYMHLEHLFKPITFAQSDFTYRVYIL